MSRRSVIGRMTGALILDAPPGLMPEQDSATSLLGCGALPREIRKALSRGQCYWLDADGLPMITFVVHLHRALSSSVARDDRGKRM